jgi:antitoxin ParD1/3/4
MATAYTLDEHLDEFVQAQISSGRYSDATAVLRHALTLMEDRERRASELDAALRHGLDDAAAGRMRDADKVFADLDRDLAALSADTDRRPER